ncbi:SusD domain-containing protein [Proteiniphilum saccharofermentans]|uniref:SusD domain-containing protein n=1 Tax=Proteiniphilum saccharofermentans TaxID=1642647 RepID=A0A1R3SUJ2_9BACT|nr:RagB/SusD family nutrient uptake outer membrane protein [Proteiniphilum saccharofermentans]SCD19241.1 SusD domain-containing protein [Proteiniphilum saccharofermentans]
MKKIIYYLVLITIIVFSSCNDDFLDRKPLDKLSEEAVFTNESLMEQYVNALYNVIPHPFTEGTMAAITDEAFFRFGGTSTNYIVRGELSPDNVIFMRDGGPAHNTRMTFLNLWPRVFSYVRDMNLFLSRVDDAPIGEEVKKQLKGEVYFLRAWTYSNLLARYGGVPIIENVFQLGDQYDLVRDNYDDCVDFVISDLNEAINLLDDKPKVQGRVGADICIALKARTYLYAASPLFNDPTDPTGNVFKGTYNKEKWKLARDAAKELIDRANTGAYELAATYDDYWTNTGSKEVIWAKYFLPTSGNLAQLFYAPSRNIGGWVSCTPVENLICDYEMAATGKKPFEEGSGYNPEDPWGGRDPRFYKSILPPETEYMGYVLNMCEPAPENTVLKTNDPYQAEANQCTGYWLRKWLIDDEPVSESVNATLMYPWFRLAEIYLIYAEASLEYNSDVATCAEYINKIRDRADVMMPHVSSSLSVEEMREKLIQERRIEYAFEDQRYFDLRRWKLAEKYENIMTYAIKGIRHDNGTADLQDDRIEWKIAKKGTDGEPDYSECLEKFTVRKFLPQHYLMPIPRNEYTKSEGVIVQNPFYD